ncbi:hypothetical protein ATI61_106499 [Archangium gephyra]|uniref:VIT domain-containing protein n=1 Tax=Archangium gephyra TaxID=48 RepID=A0AAC8Q1M0_9BACT|nr:hypothetical protein [Archangium gephyra]AKI99121.1 Hypothetical protein AA314_00748 [Archangium gephyra]REG31029.1 hypothetical protein ATI61_106499 [Archangium gephyra]
MRPLIGWPLLLALLAFPTPVLADIAPDPLAGLSEPRPLDAKAAQGISMKHEEVIIELHDDYALVDATFTMANPGPPRELQVGFPGSGVRLDIPEEYASHDPLEGFSVWVEGRAVPHEARELERSSSYAGRTKTWPETWHVFTPRFARGDTRIRVRYGVVANPYSGRSAHTGEKIIDGRRVWYILETGGLWAGPIGEIIVRIRARGGVKPESIRVRTHARETRWKVPKPGAASPLLEVTRNAEGLTIRCQRLDATRADNLQLVYSPDPERVPHMSSPWDTGAATRLLREALGVRVPDSPSP